MSFHILKVRQTLHDPIDPRMVATYLPKNFRVLGMMEDEVLVIGEDHLGWTAEHYVIPRLRSAVMSVEEVDLLMIDAGQDVGYLYTVEVVRTLSDEENVLSDVDDDVAAMAQFSLELQEAWDDGHVAGAFMVTIRDAMTSEALAEWFAPEERQ